MFNFKNRIRSRVFTMRVLKKERLRVLKMLVKLELWRFKVYLEIIIKLIDIEQRKYEMSLFIL